MKLFYLLLFLFLFHNITFSQCNTANFTVSTTNATCLANAEITVQVPGALSCNGWTAILTLPNSTEISLAIPANGGPVTFSGLPAGNYLVRLFNPSFPVVNYNNNPVSVNTSYTEMVINTSTKYTTCPSWSTNYVKDGELTITINTGGTGPYIYEITGDSTGTFTFGPTTNTSHTFNNIADFDLVAYTVTDLVNNQPGCAVSKTSTIQMSRNPFENNNPHLYFNRLEHQTCNYFEIHTRRNMNYPQNAAVASDSNNVTISINNGPEQQLYYTPPVLGGLFVYRGDSIIGEPGDTYIFKFSDGCNEYRDTGVIPPINDNYFRVFNLATITDSCAVGYVYRLLTTTHGLYRNFYLDTAKLVLERETSPGIWDTVKVKNYTNNPSYKWDTVYIPGRYRATLSDACHSNTDYFNTASPPSLSNITIREGRSYLEGTSSISVSANIGIVRQLSYPLNIQITPNYAYTNPVSIVAPEPLNHAGTYGVNFPVNKTVESTTPVNWYIMQIGDLPLGSYTVKISDLCGDTLTDTIILTQPASYNYNVNVNVGCNNANSFKYSFNGSSNIIKWPRDGHRPLLYYYDTSNNTLGTRVYNVYNENENLWTTNIPSGNYAINIGYPYYTGYCRVSYSAAFLESTCNRDIILPFNIPAYQDINVFSSILSCNDSTKNIVVDIVSGTPVYPLIYSLYDSSNLTTPVYTDTAFSSTDSIATQKVFKNIDTAYYILAVTSGYSNLTPNGCYQVNQNLLVQGDYTLPNLQITDSIICFQDSTTLSLNTLPQYWDINWYNSSGNKIDSNTTFIKVSPIANDYYIINYQLKNGIGCYTTELYTDTAWINVIPQPSLKSLRGDSVCYGSSATIYVYNVDSNTTYEVLQNNLPLLPRLIDSTHNSGDTLAFTIPSSILTQGDNKFEVVAKNGSCANYLMDSIIIYSRPIINPVAICKDTIVYLNNQGNYTIDSSYINNGSWDRCYNITMALSKTSFTCTDTGINPVTLYVTNDSNYIDSCLANITVWDTIKPTVLCQNISVSLNNYGQASIQTSDINNGSFDNCTIDTLFLNKYDFNCSNIGINQVTLTAIDIFGNIDSCYAQVTVIDNDAPTILCPADQYDTAINSCEYTVIDYQNMLPISDNCSDSASMQVEQIPAPGTILNLQGGNTTETIMLSVTDTNQNISNCSFFLNVFCVKELIIPQFISPNEDGLNDIWYIKNLELFGVASVKIFNRWGALVYQTSDYKNNWGGIYSINNGENGNKILPSGTYFYILDVNRYKTYKGYIQIRK